MCGTTAAWGWTLVILPTMPESSSKSYGQPSWLYNTNLKILKTHAKAFQFLLITILSLLSLNTKSFLSLFCEYSDHYGLKVNRNTCFNPSKTQNTSFKPQCLSSRDHRINSYLTQDPSTYQNLLYWNYIYRTSGLSILTNFFLKKKKKEKKRNTITYFLKKKKKVFYFNLVS